MHTARVGVYDRLLILRRTFIASSTSFITEDMATTVVGAVVSLTGVAWWALWDRTRPLSA